MSCWCAVPIDAPPAWSRTVAENSRFVTSGAGPRDSIHQVRPPTNAITPISTVTTKADHSRRWTLHAFSARFTEEAVEGDVTVGKSVMANSFTCLPQLRPRRFRCGQNVPDGTCPQRSLGGARIFRATPLAPHTPQ